MDKKDEAVYIEYGDTKEGQLLGGHDLRIMSENAIYSGICVPMKDWETECKILQEKVKMLEEERDQYKKAVLRLALKL